MRNVASSKPAVCGTWATNSVSSSTPSICSVSYAGPRNAPTLFVDASAIYNLTENLKLIVGAQNLTDERKTLYIDSVREDRLFETRIDRTLTVGATAKF